MSNMKKKYWRTILHAFLLFIKQMISTPLLGPFSEVHVSVCWKCTETWLCLQTNFKTEKSYGNLAYLFLSKMPGGFQECVLIYQLTFFA